MTFKNFYFQVHHLINIFQSNTYLTMNCSYVWWCIWHWCLGIDLRQQHKQTEKLPCLLMHLSSIQIRCNWGLWSKYSPLPGRHWKLQWSSPKCTEIILYWNWHSFTLDYKNGKITTYLMSTPWSSGESVWLVIQKLAVQTSAQEIFHSKLSRPPAVILVHNRYNISVCARAVCYQSCDRKSPGYITAEELQWPIKKIEILKAQ